MFFECVPLVSMTSALGSRWYPHLFHSHAFSKHFSPWPPWDLKAPPPGSTQDLKLETRREVHFPVPPSSVGSEDEGDAILLC